MRLSTLPLLLLAAATARAAEAPIIVDGHIDIPSAMLDLDYDIGAPGDRPGCTRALHAFSGELPKRSDGNYCTDFDLARAGRGGLSAAFFSIYVDTDYVGRTAADGGGPARRAFDMIDVVQRQVARHSGRVVLARTADEVRAAHRAGRFAVLLGIEGGHAIENSLPLLRAFAAQGVRYMTLTHTQHTDWADSAGGLYAPRDPRHGGLTNFGREVVREMNRLGVVVDVSHVSEATVRDVLATTTKPVMASHSSARALADHHRNLSDDSLRAIARNGGVVMVNFYADFIDPAHVATLPARSARMSQLAAKLGAEDPRLSMLAAEELLAELPAPAIERLVDHIAHIAKVAGVEHVGLGSDFDGAPRMPAGLESVDRLPALVAALERRGFRGAALRGILGENILRVLEANERP